MGNSDGKDEWGGNTTTNEEQRMGNSDGKDEWGGNTTTNEEQRMGNSDGKDEWGEPYMLRVIRCCSFAVVFPSLRPPRTTKTPQAVRPRRKTANPTFR
jgi:hypothetical protein